MKVTSRLSFSSVGGAVCAPSSADTTITSASATTTIRMWKDSNVRAALTRPPRPTAPTRPTRAADPTSSRLGMRLAIHLNQLRRVDMCVALRGAQSRVPQQFLNGAQVGAALQKVRGKGVTQRMWTDAELGAALGHIAVHQPMDAASRQSRAAIVHEHRVALLARDGQGHAIFEPLAQRALGRVIEWHDPLLRSLAHHAHSSRAQVDILHVDANQLAEAQPRRVEELEDGTVAAAKR